MVGKVVYILSDRLVKISFFWFVVLIVVVICGLF